MKKLKFTTETLEDGNILCRYNVDDRCYTTTISLLYNNDLLQEYVVPPEDIKIYAWMTHPFLKNYPNKEIKILQDYFGHKGNEETDLFYVHPRKCGGSSIEIVGYEHGIRWGKWSESKYDYHAPSDYFMNVKDLVKNKILFTSVRNPYERLISGVYCPFNKVNQNRATKTLTIEEFNHYLNLRINNENLVYDFVYYEGKKIVPHVLKLENLTYEFNKLMFDYHCDVKMQGKNNSTDSYFKNKKFTIEHINSENLKLINKKFEKDFKYFDYEMIKS